MIGYLKGKIISRHDTTLILDVAGVGYRVRVEKSVLDSPKDIIEVYTFTYVRDDALELYGFRTQKSLALFEKLISISGIGPKIGIGIFSLGTYAQIVTAIQKADVPFFTSLPKLGKKNAQKIIIELKNKVGGEELELSEDPETESLTQALTSFGYTQQEITRALKKMDGKGKSLEEKVKLALKTISS